MDVKRFTIILQGSLNKISLNGVGYYKTVADVVVSYWDTDDESLLDSVDLSGVVLVKNSLAGKRVYDFGNVYKQTLTTYSGLSKTRTEFSIKTRSDACFGDMSFLMNEMERNPDRLFSGSVMFCKTKRHTYHAGDHVIAAKTKTYRLGMRMLKSLLEHSNPDSLILIPENRYHSVIKKNQYLPHQFASAEQLITKSLLYSKKIKDQPQELANEIMKDNYHICKYDRLGDIVFTHDRGTKVSNFAAGTWPDGAWEDGGGFNNIGQIGE